MKLFDIFGKKAEGDINRDNRKASDIKALEIFSGMRVVVEDLAGRMLFIAKLQEPQGNMAELSQYSDTEVFQDMDTETCEKADSFHVKMRGYNDRERKAVFMEGIMSLKQKHIWKIEDLSVIKVENERTFPRLNTDIGAVITASGGDGTGGESCRLLNISVGGAGIGSKRRYHKGDRFILKVKLTEDAQPSVMYCEVLRVIEKEISSFEYGCRFLELTEADREQITHNIELFQKGNRNLNRLP